MFDKKKILVISVIIIILIIGVFIKKIILKSENKYEKLSFNEVVVSSQNNTVENITDLGKIKIHITGEINNSGLIELDAGSRVQDAIEIAGGVTENADISKTNLAYILSDGEKIYIPSKDDENVDVQSLSNKSSKVNLNTATIKDLQAIPGVGESTAKAIINYREKNGKFMTIEDIQNVAGIGESKFEKMKEYIAIK